MANFEFSNEAYNGAGWAGGATAQQYASALNDWIPALRQIKPDILISMDGVKDHGTVGDFEPWYISPQPLWYQMVSAAFLKVAPNLYRYAFCIGRMFEGVIHACLQRSSNGRGCLRRFLTISDFFQAMGVLSFSSTIACMHFGTWLPVRGGGPFVILSSSVINQ